MPTYKIIGGDGKQYGPVADTELRQWIAEGRLNGQSLAQAEGSAEWKPLSAFPEFAEVLQTHPGPSSAAPPENPADWAGQILARKPELHVGDCLSSGWSFFASNAGFVFVAVLLVCLANFVMAFIPFIGGIVHLLLSGVVTGGFYLACLRRMRGEEASVGDVFAGFKLCFVQLMLAGAVTKILTQIGLLFCFVPWLYLTVAWTFALPLVADKRLEFWSAMELSRKVVSRVWFKMFLLLVIAFLPVIAFNIFSAVKMGLLLYGMLQDAQFDIARLLEVFRQHSGELMKAGVLLGVLGMAILFVNMLFAVGMLMRAYENLFGARKP